MIFGIVFNFFIFILNIAALYTNYTKGHFLLAVFSGICIGITFMNVIWLLLKLKEDL